LMASGKLKTKKGNSKDSPVGNVSFLGPMKFIGIGRSLAK